MSDRKNTKLRSRDWFDDQSRPDQTAIYVERYLNYGLTLEELQSGKPVVGIAQSGSDLTPCHRHHQQLAERVKQGIRDAGGIPMEFPVHPIHEQGRRPTAALDRNLAYIGLVEILHGYPLDSVVLTTGCDKTTPSMLMAACNVDLPAIVLSGGPMLNGWQGERRMGSGSIIWESREQLARGEIDYDGFMQNVASGSPSIGHCNTMGTALTMNCLAEALGMSLPGCAAIPAPYKERSQIAYESGRRAVEIALEDLKPSKILDREAFINAIKTCSAIGGSTNAPVHIQAIANQLDVELSIDDWQRYGESVAMIVNTQPAGEYLGEDFYRAGGLPAVLGELLRAGVLNGECRNINGQTMARIHSKSESINELVIKKYSAAVMQNAGFAVMKGNLFDSALMKKSVISDDFKQKYLSDSNSPNVFSGRAIVFEGPEDYHDRINDPDLNIDENCILVIRYCGPLGYPGSAEVVNMLPPDELVKKGIKHLPCIGDGRQSGTSASPSILNASPEAAAGGGLALLNTDDVIEINLNDNSVNVLLSEEALNQRREELIKPVLEDQTLWQEIYRSRVTQLDQGADFSHTRNTRDIIARHGTPRHSH